MKRLAELLLEIDIHSVGKGKTVIFSQFTAMLDLVQQFLDAEGFVLARCEYQFF